VKKIVVLVNNKWLLPAKKELACDAWWCSSCSLRFRCFTEEPLILTEKEIRDNSRYNGHLATALQLWMVKGRK